MALKFKRKDMKRVIYAIYLGVLSLFCSFFVSNKIEGGLSILVSIGILGLFELVSINDKLNKWK